MLILSQVHVGVYFDEWNGNCSTAGETVSTLFSVFCAKEEAGNIANNAAITTAAPTNFSMVFSQKPGPLCPTGEAPEKSIFDQQSHFFDRL